MNTARNYEEHYEQPDTEENVVFIEERVERRGAKEGARIPGGGKDGDRKIMHVDAVYTKREHHWLVETALSFGVSMPSMFVKAVVRKYMGLVKLFQGKYTVMVFRDEDIEEYWRLKAEDPEEAERRGLAPFARMPIRNFLQLDF